jgi:integration host factor subunit alpha
MRRYPKVTLTKKDLVKLIQKQNGYTQHQSYEIVESVSELIKSTLENGDYVLISGFGKFCVKQKDARKGRNPAKGDSMMLRPRTVVTFKCSRTLRDKVNGKE